VESHTVGSWPVSVEDPCSSRGPPLDSPTETNPMKPQKKLITIEEVTPQEKQAITRRLKELGLTLDQYMASLILDDHRRLKSQPNPENNLRSASSFFSGPLNFELVDVKQEVLSRLFDSSNSLHHGRLIAQRVEWIQVGSEPNEKAGVRFSLAPLSSGEHVTPILGYESR
jgi:hypothetical protein